jgi:hypothetical protein
MNGGGNQIGDGGTYNENIMVRGEEERGSPVNFEREISPQERPALIQ